MMLTFNNYDLQQKMLKELSDQYKLYAISLEATIARIEQAQLDDEPAAIVLELLAKRDLLLTVMYDIDSCRAVYLAETGRLN